MNNDIIVPLTIKEAKKNISELTGVPEKDIDIDIDFVTPIYTQFSLKNLDKISDIAMKKEMVGTHYRFENKDVSEKVAEQD